MIFTKTKNITVEKQQATEEWIEIMPMGTDRMRVWRWSKKKLINSLVDIEDSPNYESFLIDALKNTKVSSTKYKDSIQIVSDIPICKDDTYLFVVGFNQDVLPKIHKDEDYISDSIKDEVLLDNSYT